MGVFNLHTQALSTMFSPRRTTQAKFFGIAIFFGTLLLFSPVLAQAQDNSGPPDVGDQLSDFEFTLLDSDEVISPESMQGTYYMVYLWSTSCGVCRQEMPELHEMYDAMAGENFEILSIAVEEDVERVAHYREEEHPMPWQHVVFEFDREIIMELSRKFASGMPAKIVVSPDGTILEVVSGRSETDLTEMISEHVTE